MGVDNSDVLKAINELAEKVEQYHGDFREFRGSQTVEVNTLKKEAESNRFWLKVQAVCIVPLMGGVHQVAQHFGWLK